MKLWEAIFISACLPTLFQPYKYNDEYYCDGGVKNNFAIDLIPKNELNKTIGITTKRQKADPLYVNNMIEKLSVYSYHEYFLSIMSLSFEKEIYKVYDDNYNVIVIDIDNDSDFINFNITNDNKLNMIDKGYMIGISILPNIINKLFNIIINNNKKYLIDKYNLIL